MKIQTIVLVFLLVSLSISLAQHERKLERKGQRKRMRQKGPKRALSVNRTARRQPKPGLSVVPPPNIPVINTDDNIVTVIDSYKGFHQSQSSYDVLPGKKGHCKSNGMILHNKAVWSPKPCITCLCSNGNAVCDATICPSLTCSQTETPEGECCPVCKDIVTNFVSESDRLEFSGDSSEPNDPSDPVIAPLPRTQMEIDELLKQEEEELQEEEEMMRKKEAERKRKKEKMRQEKEEKRRQLLEAKHKEEEEMLRRMEEQQLKRAIEEEEERKEMEKRKREEDAKRYEQKLEKERKERKEKQKEAEEESEEEENILRGDVFRMPSRHFPTPETFPFPPEDIPSLPMSLPAGCVISDFTLSCSNSKVTHIPPIVDTELKSLNLAGNAITVIPAEAFNGVPNLEWIDLSKNKITSAGINPKAFSKLKKLERLYLDGNLLEHIPPELPSTLREVKINENNLKSIDEESFQDLSNLVTLELEGNKLDEGSVSPLAFKPLKQLSYLRLGRNRFRTIPQGLPPSIEELHLEHNHIEEISELAFNNTKHLSSLILRYNKIDETRIAPLAWIHHEALESIDLSYNKLYQVPSFLPKSLLHLVLMGNQIERIPGFVFAHMHPGIEYLYLSFNKLNNDGIDTTSFYGAYNSLIELYLDHNDLTMVPLGISDMKELHFLRLNDNKIRNVSPESICPDEEEDDLNIVSLHLENNYIDTRRISAIAFACIPSYSGIVIKPQKIK